MTYPPCPPIHNSRSKHMKKPGNILFHCSVRKKPGFGGSSSTCVVCDSHKRGGRKRYLEDERRYIRTFQSDQVYMMELGKLN